jgi:hypothetical protein
VHVEKNRQTYVGEPRLNQRVADLLSESERAVRNGNLRDAYELSLRATQAAPDSIEAWQLRATLARSLEERIICVNRLIELGADRHDRHNVVFFTIKETLDQDPFLAYVEETDRLYRVLNGTHQMLNIPKKRTAVNAFLVERPSRLKAAYRWLVMAILGLMFAGLGTLIFAPLAALSAFRAESSLQSDAERVSSTMVLFLSLILFLIGFFFSFLFVIHLIG